MALALMGKQVGVGQAAPAAEVRSCDLAKGGTHQASNFGEAPCICII